MDKIDLNSLTEEQKAMAMECENPEELIALAKKGGFEITKEQAEAYLDELQNVELDNEMLKKIAGGCLTAAENGVCYAVGGCAWHV